MSRLAGIVLRLYPAAWRERYRKEYEALLEDHGVGAGTLADMLRGALDARVRELAGAAPERRRRTALAVCLWAAAASAAAVAGFAKMVEYEDFTAAAAHHAPVAAGRDLILAGAAVVALAVCAAGLVILAAVGRELHRGGRDLARPLTGAGVATAVVALALALLAVYARSAAPRPPHDPRTLAILAAWLVVSAAATAVALANGSRVLLRVPLAARELRLVLGAAWAAAGGMCVTAAGLAVWGVALATESGPVFHLSDGGLLATPTVATWAAEAVLGAGAAAFAIVGLTRAGGASPRLRSAPSSPASPPPAGRSSSSG